MPKTLAILLLILFAGCQPPTDNPKAIPSKATADNTPSAMAELLSGDQYHLFMNSWFADYDQTKKYNLESDPDGQTAWLHCTQFKEVLTFTDKGIRWENRVHGTFVEELDFRSDAFKQRFNLIDKNHLAVRKGEHWVIYLDARPPKHQPPMVANALASNDIATAEETPELSHLFSTAWFADHDSTKQYNIVSEPTGDFAKLHCIQYVIEMGFRNEGMSWRTKETGNTNIPVDFKSDNFKKDFKQIDKTHLAVRMGEHWLVFSSTP